MSTQGISEGEVGGQIQGLSKRQQNKINQAIKIIEAKEVAILHSTQNPEAKTHKRRAHTSIKGSETLQRKIVKTQSVCSEDRSKEVTSSVLQGPQQQTETANKTGEKESEPKRSVFNEKYDVPDGESALFSYILNYSYLEKEKNMEKQGQEWTSIGQIGGEGIAILSNATTARAFEKMSLKFSEIKNKIHEPFNKAHRQFSQKFNKKEFLCE